MRRTATLVAWSALAAFSGCDRGEPGRIPSAEGTVTVTVSRPAMAAGTAAFAATVRAVERADLATRVSGTVVAVPVDVGSQVTAGQVVLRLDAEDVAARTRAADAELDRARRAFERMAALHTDGAATDQELDDARARFRIAEAGFEEARAQRAYVTLRAPFAGVVTSRSVDPGDLAVPGRPVLGLAGGSSLEAVTDLPGAWSGSVAAGDTVAVVQPETGERIPALVARVAPALEASSRRFRVEASLPATAAGTWGLVPGAYVQLEVSAPGRGSLWIPADAEVTRGQLTGVFTVEEGAARLRWIRPGERRGEALEVLAGLSGGVSVVRRPPPGLEDGQAVAVEREEPFPAAPLPDGPGASAGES